MFCITKEKKHLKENIKPHFIRRILIQMRLSLLSLFSIKNSRSFVPLNFINEAIIRGAASQVPLAIGVWCPAAALPPPPRCRPAAVPPRRLRHSPAASR